MPFLPRTSFQDAANGYVLGPEVLSPAAEGRTVEVSRHPTMLLACDARSYRLAVIHWPIYGGMDGCCAFCLKAF